MQDVMKLKEMIEKSRELKAKAEKEAIAKELVVKTIEVKEEPINTLPSTFISASTIRLSSKEATNALTFHERLSQSDERYDAIKIPEEKGKKILRGMVRLTTGSAAVVPMKCKGNECSMKDTCVTGDTLVLTSKGHVEIRNIQEKDRVYSLTIGTKRFHLDTVTKHSLKGVKEVFEIKTKYGNSIRVTEDHAILCYTPQGYLVWNTIENGLSKGFKIVVEDFESKFADVINSDGDIYVDIISSITSKGLHDVYDITIKDNQNFIANNIIVHNCPYFQENAAPVGLPCLVERDLISYWMERYIVEFNVQEDSLTDMHMISRLCEYDVYDMRLSRYLAEHDQTLLADFITAFDGEGGAITNKTVSAAFDIKERIDRSRSKTLKELMATREARQKIAVAQDAAKSSMNFSHLQKSLDDVLAKREKVVN